MKSFHRTMGTMAGVFFLMILVSVAIATSYIRGNDLSASELWKQGSQLESSGGWNFGGFLNANNTSSSYATKTLVQSDTFKLKPEIFISSSIEEVFFIEEDRDDIKVDFYRSYPDTSAYKVSYKSTTSRDQISISSTLRVRGLSINQNYEGSISVYIPRDYHFERITLDSAAPSISSKNIYTNTDQLNIIASFGDIDLSIDQGIDSVNVECSMGSVELVTKAYIHKLEVECDMGSVVLSMKEKVDFLDITTDMGDTDINSSAPMDYIHLESNMGKIRGQFLEEVQGMKAEADLGSIILHFYENDNMTVNVDTDMGTIHSDFPITEKDSEFSFTSDMGSIDILQN